MHQTLNSIRVALFFLLGLGLIFVVYAVVGQNQWGRGDGYRVVAVFDDIKTLTPGSEVRIAGVRVGEVEKTELVRGQGQAVLLIEHDFAIPQDSVARIAVASLLGQNYIAVEHGQASTDLQDGDPISTAPTADFNDIINEISALGQKFNQVADSFSGLGGEDMSNLFTNLNGMVEENREQIAQIVDQLDAVTQKLNSTEGTLGRLINDDAAYEELTSMIEEIRLAASDARSTLAQTQGMLAHVQAGEGTIGKLLYDDAIALELETTVQNLNEFSVKLNSADGTLGKLINDDELYYELRAMLQKADQALDTVGDAGPITAVGTVGGALF